MISAGRSNLLAFGLFLSLAVNFFLAGWLIGRHPGFGPPPPPPPFDRFFDEHIRSSLSPDGAKKLEVAFETIRRRFAEHAEEARASRERLFAILNADRFDPADYIAAAKAARLEHDNDREAADEELVRAIAQLSPDDRRKLAEIRRHPPRPGPGGPGPGFGGFH
jgi:uncharacterized membrane protein